ncbi:MAG TPA: PhoPQ-activated protein PqaA family protein, partial [Pirellulales bacterium]|nr:PhoPQ-activated protein PqaA family protein [Pirellulales bacterium]
HVTDIAGNQGFSSLYSLKVDTSTSSALQDYVNAPDSSYHYTLNSTITGSGFTEYIYDMISQTWRTTADVNNPVWHHWLQVIVPNGTVSTTALLLIDSGSNGPNPPGVNSTLAADAVALHTVVVDLPEVPNEPLVFTGDPLHESRTEDEIIAYTFSQYEATGDPTWPALLPMVKAAVRAMDTTQTVVPTLAAGDHIDHFVVTGYSKRGWTTWLTTAVDSRVSAIIPGVFDALNLDEQMIHHYAFYSGIPAGPTFDDGFSIAIQDYVGFDVPQDMETPAGQALLKIVDPYDYLTNGRFNIPKLEINSTGDEFFIPDSAQFYYSDLPGTENYLRYIPNTGHPLNTTDTANSTASFYNAIINNLPLPQFSWSVQPDGSIRVQTATTPTSVLMWQATNPTYRDFRYDYNSSTPPVYTSSTLTSQGGGVYVASVPTPATGATAFFVQLTFTSPLTGNPYIFTTEIKVVSSIPLAAWPFTTATNSAVPATMGADLNLVAASFAAPAVIGPAAASLSPVAVPGVAATPDASGGTPPATANDWQSEEDESEFDAPTAISVDAVDLALADFDDARD